MRVFAASLIVCAGVAWAQPGAADPSTIGDALACEAEAAPELCLLRVGARDWDGDSAEGLAVASAMLRLSLPGPNPANASSDWAQARALIEAVRLEAAGASAEAVLAPIAALEPALVEQTYILFGSGPGAFAGVLDLWRPRAAREDVVRLIAARLEAMFASDDPERIRRDEIPRVAVIYAGHGMIDDGRALLQRWQAEGEALAFWTEIGDFAAADRALRRNGDPHSLGLLALANAAVEAGDRATGTRLALELLETRIRGTNARIIIGEDKVALTRMAAAVLQDAGESERARTFALSLLQGVAPEHPMFGVDAEYALAVLETIGDHEIACDVADRLVSGADAEIVGEIMLERDQEARARARAAALAFARCGRLDDARGLAARYGIRDFWLAYLMGEPLDPHALPDIGALAQAIERDVTAERLDTASAMMGMMFERAGFFTAKLMQDWRVERPAVFSVWRDGGAFRALRSVLRRSGRDDDDTLSTEERGHVFAAALSLAPPP